MSGERLLAEAIRNLHKRLRKLENREITVFGGAMTPLTGVWTNTGGVYPNASYWRDDNGIVFLQGRVQGGAVGSTIFTLPANFRPPGTLSFTTSLGDVVEITSAGVVTLASGGSPVSLDGISYRATN